MTILTPGRYYPNSPIRLTAAFTDDAGTGIDPDTVTFRSHAPTGVTTAYVYGTDPEMGRSSAGHYYMDFTPDQGGVWHYRWETTGTNKTTATEGTVNVMRSPFIDGQDPPAYAALR